eukprot:11484696-Alexandrium_andersonii.AAC.1
MAQTPRELVSEHIESRALGLHMPPRDGNGKRWPAREVLTRFSKGRLREFEAALADAGVASTSPRFSN